MIYKIQNGWSLMIEAINSENAVFPEGNTFTTDFKIDHHYEESAICTKDGNINDNNLNLLCKPENKFIKNSLISFKMKNLNFKV